MGTRGEETCMTCSALPQPVMRFRLTVIRGKWFSTRAHTCKQINSSTPPRFTPHLGGEHEIDSAVIDTDVSGYIMAVSQLRWVCMFLLHGCCCAVVITLEIKHMIAWVIILKSVIFLIYRSNFALKSRPDFMQFQHDCSDFHHVITKGAGWRQTGSTCKEVGAVNCRKAERAPCFWMSLCTYPGKLSRNSVFSAHPAWNVWNAYSCACFSGISSLPSLLVAWS